MSKICGKIDLPVKINWSGKMPLHGTCRLQVIPKKVSPHDICRIEGKESDKSTAFSALIPQELFLQGNHW